MDPLTGRLDELRRGLGAIGPDAWLVGGAMRDLLRGEAVSDVDVAIAGDAGRASRALATRYEATRFALSDEFGAWRVAGGRLPFTVDITPLQGETILEDLSKRDLTVNAIAAPIGDGDLIDPFGGRRDIEQGVLRMVAPGAFAADAVRIVRLARLANQLGASIDAATRLRARMDAGGLVRVAGERVFAEMGLIARHPQAWRGLDALDEVGGLGVIIPELEEGRGLEQTPYHHLDVLGHTLEVARHACEMRADPAAVFRGDADAVRAGLAEPLADGLDRGDGLIFACLFHDMAKPATYAVTPEGRATFFGHDRHGAELASQWCERHRTSRRMRETMALLVRTHLVLGFLVHRQPLSLRHALRFVDRTAPATVEAIVLSCADRLATNGPRTTPPQIQRHLDVARQLLRSSARLEIPPPLLDGTEIIALAGRPAGPWTTNAVAALREEQVMGLVATRAQAERFIREWSARPDPGSVE